MLDLDFDPVPRQEIVETAHGVAIGHALEDVLEVGEWLDVVELCGGDEGADSSPADATTVGASEEMVFTAERDRPDRALDWIVVELDAAVIDKAAEGLPAREGVADCLITGVMSLIDMHLS